jgi:HEAT repeat protein
VAIKPSSAREVDALAKDLGSPLPLKRETAVARLTVIGARAVGRLNAIAGNRAADRVARLAAFRALEAIGDARAAESALPSLTDSDTSVAAAAASVAGAFLGSRRGPLILDRLTALALDTAVDNSIRLAAIRALSSLDPAEREPLWKVLRKDPDLRLQIEAEQPRSASLQAVPDPIRTLRSAAEGRLPDEAETLRRAVAGAKGPMALPTLLQIIERIRERHPDDPAWRRARGAAHVALARRGSRLGLYDLCEVLAREPTATPVEFLTALSLVGDSSCLDAIASAYHHTRDDWWRQHLSATFQAIVRRERMTRRHAVARRLARRWSSMLDELWPGKKPQ